MNEARPELTLWCDGAGAERMGKPGGWAWLAVRDDDELAHDEGRDDDTTCLVMELTAVLEALRTCRKKRWHLTHCIVIASDCTIALEAADGRFTPRPPKYHALCAQLREAFDAVSATSRWVKSHAGVRWNEEVDARAARARDEVPRLKTSRRARTK